MKLIVGLGNPGEKYESTRHNVGFMVLDHFLKDAEPVNKSNWSKEEKLKSDLYLFDYQRRSLRSGQAKSDLVEKVILAKPLTYMNNSGMAVGLIARFYKVSPSDIWIVYDELDLPIGMMKIRFGGASAGHRGVNSIIESLGTDKFWRFRMGIGQEKSKIKSQISKMRDMKDYVLGGFGRSDKGAVKHLVKRGAKALATALEKDLESAMNQFNTK